MLNENSTPFEAAKFFTNCKEELRQIAQRSALSKTIKRSEKRIQKLQQTTTQSINSQTLDRMFLHNIIVDYLRSNKLDYTYSVFMRECSMISQDIVTKGMLTELARVQRESDRQQRFNVSIVEMLVNAVHYERMEKNQVEEIGIQVDSLLSSGQNNHVLLMQNRLREVREQVEGREKKYYEKMLESMRSKEIMELRAEISDQYQQKYEKDTEKLNKKYHQLQNKAKNHQQHPDQLAKQIQKLLSVNQELKEQNSRIVEETKQLKKYKITHVCRQTKQWKEMERKVKEDRKELQTKKRELDLALSNISTKVEDLVQQKKKLDGKQKSEAFMNEARVHKQNKDHMIETIHAQMRQMNKRIKILDEENKELRKQLKIKKEKLEGGVEGDRRKKGEKEDRDKGDKKCQKCQLNEKFKPKMKDIMIWVSEADFESGEGEKNVIEESSDEDSDEQEKYRRMIENNEKIAKLKTEMKIIKNKIRISVEEF